MRGAWDRLRGFLGLAKDGLDEVPIVELAAVFGQALDLPRAQVIADQEVDQQGEDGQLEVFPRVPKKTVGLRPL